MRGTSLWVCPGMTVTKSVVISAQSSRLQAAHWNAQPSLGVNVQCVTSDGSSCWGGLGPSHPSQVRSQGRSALSGPVLPPAPDVSQGGPNHYQPRPGPAPGQVCHCQRGHRFSADCEGELTSSQPGVFPAEKRDELARRLHCAAFTVSLL